MTSMKCISCGIGFFSATGYEKCSRCAENDSQKMTDSHDSCGCGHSH